MQNITDSWISNTIGCTVLQGLFADAAMNVPDGYAYRPWAYPGLDHGKAVLTTDAQLDCYIHAYGRMHIYKLWKALGLLSPDSVMDGFEIVDWGCGQGLATLATLAWLGRHCSNAATPRRVVLLDLSEAALYRAKRLVERKLRGRRVNVEAVRTNLSAATCSEKASRHNSPVVIHLLSNIVDVPNICLEAMAEAISGSQSKSYVVCVGHCGTAMPAANFSRLLDMRGAQLLHRENVSDGAVLNTGHHFGWDITVMQRDSMAKAA